MIEQCWPWLKRKTTRKRAPQTTSEAKDVWEKARAELEQAKIQAWIRRIVRHIQEVIRLEEGNEYREGSKEKQNYYSGRKQTAGIGIEERRVTEVSEHIQRVHGGRCGALRANHAQER